MKRLSVAILILMTIVIFVQANSIHQDVYVYFNYDADGNYTGFCVEYHGASDDEALHRSDYTIVRITDADGDTHTLWVDGTYYDLIDGEWVETSGWRLPQEDIQAFFDAHTN